MATKRIESAARPSRVRFVMIEAELNENNSLSELTQAITQALKSSASQPATRALPQVQRPTQTLSSGPADIGEGVSDQETEVEPVEEHDEAAAARPARPRSKLPVPDYKHDLDLVGTGQSFKDFSTQQAPTSNMKRYLVAALWLRDHGNATADIHKMYTCYRTAGWPLNVSDWDGNFRNLVKVDKMRRVSTGEYAITPLGEADLQST